MQTKVLNYRVILEPENYPNGDKVYNAHCPTLGITDYGDSVEKVLESIEAGILLAIESLAGKGEEIPTDNIEEQIVASAKVSVPLKIKPVFA